MRLRAAAFVLALLAPAVHAASMHATVVHVSDGDTVWVRPSGGGAKLELRLLGIDAPESCQAFGPEAGRALAQRILQRSVQVRTRGRDAYGRFLARIDHEGEDVGAWMVRRGYAWSMSYQGRRGPYARLESRARRAHAGLWAAPDPEPPRSFRRRFGPCR